MEKFQGRNVLLLKAPLDSGEDPYIQLLQRVGYSGHCIPVLTFRFRDIEDYTLLLEQYTSYAAVIFTSQQAVHATALALNNIKDEEIAASIRSQRCYVVGQATGIAAESIGFSPRGSFCGNAEELAQFIVQDMEDLKSQTVLFPCGNLRKDVIPMTLVSQGYPVQEAVVYETVHRKEIHDDIKNYVESQGNPSVMVFFSPSGVQALHEGVPNLKWLPLKDIKIIAFGPSTRAELERYGCKVFKTLERPTPQGLAEALRN